MELTGTVLLAGHTARTRAYGQAMAHHGLRPQHVILFGKNVGGKLDEAAEKTARPDVPETCNSVLLPNHALPIIETCQAEGWPVHQLETSNVHDTAVTGLLQKIGPELIIYSGYSGMILKEPILGLGIPILHIHSGWLPEYRGSTTLYYSWLQDNECAATGLILDEGIDTGIIIDQRKYALPPPEVEIDITYDGAIRADLLVRILMSVGEEFSARKILSRGRPNGKGKTYYVIHPLLKHLAILSGNRKNMQPD